MYRVVDGEPHYLLICDAHGNWGFPKGHIEKGEGPEAAALREVTEEAGVPSLTLIEGLEPIDWRFTWRGTLIHKTCHYFLMAPDESRTKPQREEGITACEWTSAEEGLRRIKYENARQLLRRADAMVRSRT